MPLTINKCSTTLKAHHHHGSANLHLAEVGSVEQAVDMVAWVGRKSGRRGKDL